VTSASGSSDSPRRRGDSRTPDDLPGRLLGMCQWLSSITWGTFVIDFVGMTVPVSDTTLTTHASDRPPSRHALLAYLLGGCHSVTSVNDRIGPGAAGSQPALRIQLTEPIQGVCGRHAIATE
jgi:hypothetical protein